MFEYERAKEFLAFAIKLNPADTLAMYNLAICLNRGGDSERAIEMATRLVEREPTAKNLAMLEVTLSTTQVHSREAVIARLQSNFFAVEEANVTGEFI
jgi:Flp pilus assembly protein TadD